MWEKSLFKKVYDNTLNYVDKMHRTLRDSDFIVDDGSFVETTAVFFFALYNDVMAASKYPDKSIFKVMRKCVSELSAHSAKYPDSEELWRAFLIVMRDTLQIKRSVQISSVPIEMYCMMVCPLLTELYLEYLCGEASTEISKGDAWKDRPFALSCVFTWAFAVILHPLPEGCRRIVRPAIFAEVKAR